MLTTLLGLLVLHPATATRAQAEEGVGLSVEGVQRLGNEVTGWVVNRTDNEVTDVRLLIQENWFWADEKHPGDDNPGRGTIVRVPEPIPPNGRIKFRYELTRPLPERTDGTFQTDVKVMSFTERWFEAPATTTRTSTTSTRTIRESVVP